AQEVFFCLNRLLRSRFARAACREYKELCLLSVCSKRDIINGITRTRVAYNACACPVSKQDARVPILVIDNRGEFFRANNQNIFVCARLNVGFCNGKSIEISRARRLHIKGCGTFYPELFLNKARCAWKWVIWSQRCKEDKVDFTRVYLRIVERS